jgi:hypothetical protein
MVLASAPVRADAIKDPPNAIERLTAGLLAKPSASAMLPAAGSIPPLTKGSSRRAAASAA